MAQFAMPDILKVPPISTRGNIMEIVRYFETADRMHQAVDQMQALLYALAAGEWNVHSRVEGG